MAGQVINVNDFIILKAWTSDTDQASVQRVWYFCNASAGAGATDLQLATQANATLAPIYKTILNNNATYHGIQTQLYRLGQPFAAQQDSSSTGAGTAGATAMARQVAGITTLTTAYSGRRYRGRIYWPFPATAADTGNGVPTAGYLTILDSLGIYLINTIVVGSGGNTSTLIPVLQHAAGKTPTPAPTPLLDALPVGKWATQRRRGSYGRVNVSPI